MLNCHETVCVLKTFVGKSLSTYQSHGEAVIATLFFFLQFDIFWDAWHEVAEVFQVSWQVYFSSWIFWKNVCTKDNNKPYPSSKHHASTKHRSTRHTSSPPLHFLFGGFADSNFVAAEQIGSFSPDKLRELIVPKLWVSRLPTICVTMCLPPSKWFYTYPNRP